MRFFMIVVLLNICSYAEAQIRNINDSINTRITRPENVTISGENILIYRWDDTKSTDNYSITSYLDSVHFSLSDIPLEVKPKTGLWYKPFCAYPLNEDLVIKGSLIPNYNKAVAFHRSEGIIMLKYNGKSKEYRILTVSGKKSISLSSCIFNCKKLPSILIFGDLDDSKNQFVVIFK